MLLVITPSAKARGCAQAIQQVTSEETHVAATSSQALARLRAQEYVAVLIDQAFLETEPVESDMVLEHIGTAVPVHVNFAINGMDRVARELRAACIRHKRASPAGPAGSTTRTAKRTQRAPSRPCCSRAKWRCKSRISRAKPKARCAASTSLPRKYALKLEESRLSRFSAGAPLRPSESPGSAIFCAPARFPRKSFTDIAVPALQ